MNDQFEFRTDDYPWISSRPAPSGGVSPRSLVIVVSAEATPGMVQQAHDAGAVGYVGKDRAAGELTATILEVVRVGRPSGRRPLVDDSEAVLLRSA